MGEFGQGLNIYTKINSFHYSLLLKHFSHVSLCGLTVRALGSQPGEPGSIPDTCLNFILFLLLKIDLVSKKLDFLKVFKSIFPQSAKNIMLLLHTDKVPEHYRKEFAHVH